MLTYLAKLFVIIFVPLSLSVLGFVGYELTQINHNLQINASLYNASITQQYQQQELQKAANDLLQDAGVAVLDSPDIIVTPPEVTVTQKKDRVLYAAVILSFFHNAVGQITQFLGSKAKELLTGAAGSFVTKLPRKIIRLDFETFLRTPTNTFPGKDTKSVEELVGSEFHRLLFKLYGLSANENLYSGNQETINTLKQFKEDAFMNKQKYLDKVHEAALNLFPNHVGEYTPAYQFWSTHFEGLGDRDVMYAIQCLYLSFHGPLNPAQYDHYYELVFDQLIGRLGIGKDFETTDQEVQLLATACGFVLQRSVQTALLDLYRDHAQESKEKLKELFRKVYIAQTRTPTIIS